MLSLRMLIMFDSLYYILDRSFPLPKNELESAGMTPIWMPDTLHLWRMIGAGSIQKSVAHCLMPTFKEKRLLWKSFAIRQWWMNHLLTDQCYFTPLDPTRVNNRYIHLENHASLYIDPSSLAIPWTYNLCWNTLSTTTTYKWKPTPREKVMIAYPLSRFPCPKKYKWQHTRTHRRHLLNTYHVIFAKQHSTLLKNKVFLLYSRLGHPVTSAESNCNSKWQSIHLT